MSTEIADEINNADGQEEQPQTLSELLGNIMEKETPSEPSPEKNPADKTPSSEGEHTQDDKNKPLHENPRFKEVIEEKNQWKAQAEADRKEREALAQRIQQLESGSRNSPPNEPPPIPKEFIELYGENANNPDTFQQFANIVATIADQKFQHLKSIEQQEMLRQQKEQQEKYQLQKQLAEQFEIEFEKKAQEHNFDKGAFRSYFREHPILNGKTNELDFEEGAKMFKAMFGSKPSRKELGESKNHLDLPAEKKSPTISEAVSKSRSFFS